MLSIDEKLSRCHSDGQIHLLGHGGMELWSFSISGHLKGGSTSFSSVESQASRYNKTKVARERHISRGGAVRPQFGSLEKILRRVFVRRHLAALFSTTD